MKFTLALTLVSAMSGGASAFVNPHFAKPAAAVARVKTMRLADMPKGEDDRSSSSSYGSDNKKSGSSSSSYASSDSNNKDPRDSSQQSDNKKNAKTSFSDKESNTKVSELYLDKNTKSSSADNNRNQKDSSSSSQWDNNKNKNSQTTSSSSSDNKNSMTAESQKDNRNPMKTETQWERDNKSSKSSDSSQQQWDSKSSDSKQQSQQQQQQQQWDNKSSGSQQQQWDSKGSKSDSSSQQWDSQQQQQRDNRNSMSGSQSQSQSQRDNNNPMMSSSSQSQSGNKRGKMSESMPFMECSPALDGSLAGDVGFDPLGFAKTKEDLMNYREAEIKHSRLAMLAAAGWPLSEVLDKRIAAAFNLPPLLESSDRAPSLLNGGLGKISPAYWIICLLAAAAIDVYGIQKAQSREPGYTPGNLGFDPLGLYPKTEKGQKWMQLAEIKHGRLAMLAITGFAFQEYFAQSGVINQTPLFFQPPTEVL